MAALTACGTVDERAPAGDRSALVESADDTATPTKQIAAPPEDFARLQLPDPARSGIRSQTAMVAVDLARGKDGTWGWRAELPIDSSAERARFMVLAPGAAGWRVTLRSEAGDVIELDANAPGITSEDTRWGIANQSYPARVFTVDRPAIGTYEVSVIASTPSRGQASGPDGYLVVSSDSPVHIYSHLTSHDLLVGREVGLATRACDASRDDDGAVTALVGVIESARMSVRTPDGQALALPMADGGDGVFAGRFVPRVAGEHTAQVVVRGTGPDGRAFVRTSEHVFPVIASDLVLSGEPVDASVSEDDRLQISLIATGSARERLRIGAELWVANAEHEKVPVAWIGGLVAPVTDGERVEFAIGVDGRWLAHARARDQLELRNVRLQHADTHIPVARLDRVAVRAPELPAAAFGTAEDITDEMLMGPRPESPGVMAAGGGVLMLVHGYCSGGVWPTGDFSQYAEFSDHDQNRSHDQFAQLIGIQGSAHPSFGVVAHSQGGAAALHLYTYYWSGLDFSSGSRLIQSVGTPYQGTPLAGDLALLGQIFGAGCGTNWDMTYSGASLWLSGIPSWARSRVYYATTSYEDVWWRYDYCHLVTDPFLGDPDDGTTEKSAGQLSGGNNLGHKKGWCHTSSMRDSAQYDDHGRNAEMNTHGNR